MMNSMGWGGFASGAAVATVTLAMLFSAGSIAAAQVAGGSQAGAGPPQGINNALLDSRPDQPEPTQCIHRANDLRRNSDSDGNRLSIWLSVQKPAIATIKASGSASGPNTGTFGINVMRDGIPVGNAQETRGTNLIFANASGKVSLVPGRQYKITAKATVSNKRLDLFDLYVGVGTTCP